MKDNFVISSSPSRSWHLSYWIKLWEYFYNILILAWITIKLFGNEIRLRSYVRNEDIYSGQFVEFKNEKRSQYLFQYDTGLNDFSLKQVHRIWISIGRLLHPLFVLWLEAPSCWNHKSIVSKPCNCLMNYYRKYIGSWWSHSTKTMLHH